MTTSQQFLEIATELIGRRKDKSEAANLLDEARADYGVLQDNVEALLDKRNWTAERPRIRLQADINQRGSLTVWWSPMIG